MENGTDLLKKLNHGNLKIVKKFIPSGRMPQDQLFRCLVVVHARGYFSFLPITFPKWLLMIRRMDRKLQTRHSPEICHIKQRPVSKVSFRQHSHFEV